MSNTPSSAELTKMRGDWDAWLFDTCTIRRGTKGQDAYGETSTEGDVQSGIPCGLTTSILPGVQQIIAERQSKVADSTISFPYGTDVRVADIIVLTSQSNRRFEVLYVPAPSTFESGVQAYCREAV